MLWTRPHHLGDRSGFVGSEHEMPSLLHGQPGGRILTPKFLPWRFPLVRAFVAFLPVELSVDRQEMLGVGEVVGIRLLAIGVPSLPAGDVRMGQGH